MSRKENSKFWLDFDIRKEPDWLSAVEWGAIYVFTVFSMTYIFILLDVYPSILDKFFFPLLALIVIFQVLAVKEVRDRKGNGTINFISAFAIALLTSIIIMVLDVLVSFLTRLAQPGMQITDISPEIIIGMAIISLIIALFMKRTPKS